MLDKIFSDKLKQAETKDYKTRQQDKRKEDAYYKKLVEDFIQELLTASNPPLKPNYGTSFIDDLGENVNIYKFQYYLERHANRLAKKYNIEEINIDNIDSSNNMLIGHLELKISGNTISHEFEINWGDKHFTTEAIVE